MRIAITRTDGGVSVGEVVDAADAVEKWSATHPGQYVSHRELTDGEAAAFDASDRYFRNALKPDLTVDMGKAVEIHKDNLRRARAPLLAALDVEYEKADEKGDANAKKAIAAKKQALRDVTADAKIEAAQTPDELKAVLPAALKDK